MEVIEAAWGSACEDIAKARQENRDLFIACWAAQLGQAHVSQEST